MDVLQKRASYFPMERVGNMQQPNMSYLFRNGWMNQLPGMFAARSTGRYNGWNALADMIGAYWLKHSNDKTNGGGNAAKGTDLIPDSVVGNSPHSTGGIQGPSLENGNFFGRNAGFDYGDLGNPSMIQPAAQAGADLFNGSLSGITDSLSDMPLFNTSGKFF